MNPLAAVASLVAGIVLAGATAFGIVTAQNNSNTSPVEASNVSYGTNK